MCFPFPDIAGYSAISDHYFHSGQSASGDLWQETLGTNAF
jgi:hypothetical protein